MEALKTFLHLHIELAKKLGLDDDHVIVDREEWEIAREELLKLDLFKKIEHLDHH